MAFWHKHKKKGSADEVIAVMDEAILFSRDKWLFFHEKLKFKEGVDLKSIFAAFFVPAEIGLKARFPVLKNAPEGITALITAKGIQASGTHSTVEIEQALGVPLPD